MNEKQAAFLTKTFSIDNFNPSRLTPLELWQLREKLIDCECDDALEDEQRDVAASIVDYFTRLPETHFPKEWRLKTPPEVEAMLKNSAPDEAASCGAAAFGNALQSVPA